MHCTVTFTTVTLFVEVNKNTRILKSATVFTNEDFNNHLKWSWLRCLLQKSSSGCFTAAAATQEKQSQLKSRFVFFFFFCWTNSPSPAPAVTHAGSRRRSRVSASARPCGQLMRGGMRCCSRPSQGGIDSSRQRLRPLLAFSGRKPLPPADLQQITDWVSTGCSWRV